MKRATERKKALQSEFVLTLWKKEFGEEGLNPSSVAEWAMEKGICKPQPIDPVRQLRRELVRFLRSEMLTDSKGRQIRKNHPVVLTDGNRRFSIWKELPTAPTAHMQMSLLQRRNGIAADCRQHKLDFDFFNENRVHQEALLPFDYNFNPDVEELDLPTEYPDEKPE
jgi:hypothetical protein